MEELPFNHMEDFSFDPRCSGHSAAHSMAPYDFAPLSPTTSEYNMLFPKPDRYDHSSMHINPAAMWGVAADIDDSEDASHFMRDGAQRPAGLGKILTDYNGPVTQAFGQITPPDEKSDSVNSLDKRADSAVSGSLGSSKSALRGASNAPSSKRKSTTSKSPNKARKISPQSDDEDCNEDEGDNKRGKYREKNRVAAAKCRAKKKDHIDHLEENHRTQSVLNSALKQTEKSLRDELSFWRTQALQHSFCNCRSVQEYNMRKAQNLADESTLGGGIGMMKIRSPSLSSFSPTSSLRTSDGMRAYKAHSLTTPQLSPAMGDAFRRPFDPVSNSATLQSPEHVRGNGHMRKRSESMLGSRSLSTMAEQELKDFVDDVTER